MFLAGDNKFLRERRIRTFFLQEPGVALLVAAVNFEWTVGRALMFISDTPNKALRDKLSECHGLEKYKDLWRQELSSSGQSVLRLNNIVRNWHDVTKAFGVRHKLVHGRDRVTAKMAGPHIEALITGAGDIEDYCTSRGIRFNARIPVRRKARMLIKA